jgi:hypothetical protein
MFSTASHVLTRCGMFDVPQVQFLMPCMQSSLVPLRYVARANCNQQMPARGTIGSALD